MTSKNTTPKKSPKRLTSLAAVLFAGSLLPNICLAEPPPNWKVSSHSNTATNDPRMSISQYTDTTHYYLGDGKIFRETFDLPGFIPKPQEEIQLDARQTLQLETAIAHVTSTHNSLAKYLPDPPTNFGVYKITDLKFENPKGSDFTLELFTVSGETPKAKAKEGEAFLKNLLTIHTLLNTPIESP